MKTIKLFSKVRWLVVTCLMLLTISPQMWGAGTAISSLNFNAPTSLPSNYTYSTTNTPDIQTFVSISCVQVSPSGNSNAPTTWSATDATAPSGGKRWIAFRPDVDCRVTLKVASNSKSKIFYLLDKDHKTTSSYVSSFTTTNSSQWYTDWSVSLTNSTWYAIMANASKCYIASMQFVANPTYSETAGTELTQNSGTVTLTSSGTTIYYKWSTSSSAYAANAGSSLVSAADGNGSSPKTVTAPDGTGTYYLYAVAKSGNYYSDVVKRNFTIVAAAPACSAGEPGTITKGSASGGTGSINLTTSGSPASGDTWYWQTSSTGTDKTHSSASAYPVSAAGTYYLRSYNSSGDCWNATSTSVTVAAADLLTPITPTLSYSSTVLVGSTISPTLSGNAGGGTVTYSLNSVSPSGSLTIISGTGVVTGVTSGGTATVTATIAAKGNYAGGSATSGTITVTANTLTYNANGGSGSMANTTGNGSVTLRTNTYTKSGCSFAGWATSQENANAGTVTYANGASYTLSADATLYAVWKVNTPAVDASTNVDVYGTTTLFITIPTDAEVRYTTNGDTPTPSSDLYDEDDGIEVTSGITVKAIAVRSNHITSDVLSVPFYNLSLGCENGTCSPASPYITKNHAYSITTDGTSGYAFRGWTIESGTGSFGSASTASTTFTMTSNGATIKAWWRLQCTITFNDASPSATGGEVGRTVYEGENTNLTTDVSIPSLTGATFAGYFTEEDGAGVQLVSETGEWITDVTGYIDADGKWAYDQSSVTLYAYWVVGTKTITGAVSPDGYGSISPAFISVTEGSTVSISGNVLTCDGKTLTASPASATSAWTYAFSSWSGVADDDEIADDVTATAVFTRTGKSYTITLDKEGGSGGSSNVSATYGSVMPSPGDAPTKDDYTFGGYYSAVGGGGTQYYTNACASAKNSDFTSASTLYAKWTQSISLDSEDGSSGSSSVTATYNSATLGSITNPTKTGYTFAGWYDGDDGTGNLVINTSGVLQANVSGYTGVGGVWTSSTAQTLYAKWNVNSYGVTYAGNGNTGGTVPTDGTSYDYGSDVTVASGLPTKTNYTFVGWLNSVDNTIYRAGQSFSITDNTTLTAQWQGVSDTWGLWWFYNDNNRTTSGFGANNITGMPNTGSSNSFTAVTYQGLTASYRSGNATPTASITIPSGSTATLYFIGRGGSSRTLQLKQSSTVKYSFAPGSSEGSTGTISDIAAGTYTLTSSGNINWAVVAFKFHTPSGYNVKFQNGSVSPSSVSGMPANYSGVPSGKKIAAPATDPTAAGYIFGGWYTTSACSTPFDFDNTTITTDKTIYAKWTAKTQPTQYTVSGDTYYCPGSTATITLSSSESGASYQLKKNGSAQGDPKAGTGSALSWTGLTAGTYTISAVETATYAARDMSGSATISIYTALSKTSDPTSSKSATVGVGCALDGLAYTGNANVECQWQTCKSDGTDASDITSGSQYSNYNTATMTFTPASVGTYYFRCVVSDDCGSSFNTSVVTVTAKVAPAVYTISGTTAICSGETATITLSGSQSGLNYQLYKGGVAEGDSKSGTGSALTWTGIEAAGTYTVKTVETSTYAEATMSSSAVITVNAVTAFTTNLPTSTKYINANASYTYTIAASGTSLSYQWYTCNSDGTGKVAMSDKTTASMTYTFTNSDAPTKYVCCVVTGTCGTITSNVQPVNITPTYYLTINLNGGSGGGISSGNRPAGNFTIANSSTIPTKSGYVFLGWKFSTNNVIYQPGATVTMPSAAATLTAQWASEEFKFSKGTKGTEPTDGFVITPDNINSSAFTAGATLTGGTMTNTSGATLGINASYGFVMIKNTRSISVALSSGAFQAGTVIYLEGYTNKNSTAYTYGFSVSGNAAGSPVSETTNAYVAFKQRYVVTAGDGIAGTSSFTLTFNSSATGTQAYLSLIAIGNCLSCTTISPTLTYSATTLYAFGGTPGTATPTLNKDGNTGAVTWTSSNTDAVTVDASGNITAVGAGSATITAELPYDGTHCGGTASCDITVPALVTQTINVGSSTAWGTTPALTFTPSDKGMEQVLRLTKNTFTFDSTSTSTKQDGTSKRWMTASFTGSETTKGKYLKMAFKNTQHNLRLGEVVVPIQPISNDGSAQVEIYEGSTLRMTSTAVTGITKGSLADVHFTFASPYVFAAGSTINVYIYFYGQTTGFRMASPVLVNGAVLTDYTYTTSGNWSTAANWNWGKLPMAGDNVVLQKPVTVDNTSAVAKNVVIDKSGGNTGKLTIAADGMLIAGGTIRANGDSQTTVEDVVINCSKTSQGALIFDNPSGSKQTKGTVNFYTRSYRDNTSKKLQWQYVGIPFDDVTDEVYGGLYVNKYSETAGSWTVMRYQGDRSISAWDGLAISGDEEGYAPISGTFTSTEDKDITLTYSAAAGENLIGNSWTAPIQIADLEESDFGDATATIYLFNTGRYKTSEGSGSSTESGTKEHTAGQWMTIPISSAATGVWAGMKVIPAFNAFEVITSSEATLSLDYSKVVASATNDVNAEMRAPVRRTSAKDIDGYRIRVADELTYTDMYLFEDITFTTGHDNGWDGDYMPCDGRSAQLYAQTALGKLAVAALPDLEGTVLGFKPGQSTEYTFSFGTNAGGYYLNDLKMQESTLIQEGNTYTFNWEDGDSTNRFIISATPYKMPTGVDEAQGDKVQSDKVRKVLIDDHLYIIRAGKIFNATGNRVK